MKRKRHSLGTFDPPKDPRFPIQGTEKLGSFPRFERGDEAQYEAFLASLSPKELEEYRRSMEEADRRAYESCRMGVVAEVLGICASCGAPVIADDDHPCDAELISIRKGGRGGGG